jgi:hypothetical protein
MIEDESFCGFPLDLPSQQKKKKEKRKKKKEKRGIVLFIPHKHYVLGSKGNSGGLYRYS